MLSQKFVFVIALVFSCLFLAGCTVQPPNSKSLYNQYPDTSSNTPIPQSASSNLTSTQPFHAWNSSSQSSDSSPPPSFPPSTATQASTTGNSSSSTSNTASNPNSYTSYDGSTYTIPEPPPSPIKPDPSGTYRIYSSYIPHNGASSMPLGSNLILSSDGSWTFGSSSGRWSVGSITGSDWSQWGVGSYGPNYKLVLDNWNQVGASGPIETESDGSVDFVWVIYNTSYGMEQLKFGH